MCCSVTRKYLLAFTWPGSISAPQVSLGHQVVHKNVELTRQSGTTMPKENSQMTALISDIKVCLVLLGHIWLTDHPKLSITQLLRQEVTVCKLIVKVSNPRLSLTGNDTEWMTESATYVTEGCKAHLGLSGSLRWLLGMHAGWRMQRLLPPRHPHSVCPDPEPACMHHVC